MNKKQIKILEDILNLQVNAVELLGTKQARIKDFEEVVTEVLKERISWKVGDFLDEDRDL